MSRHEPSITPEDHSDSGGHDAGSVGREDRLRTDGGDGVFDDLEGGDLDELGDLEGDMDDDAGTDEVEDDGESGGGGADLEPRVKELEFELEDLAGSVETARRDNEEIAESLDHIQENIRQLLDVYEIVARNANPFIDGPDGDLDIGEAAFDLFGDNLEENLAGDEEEADDDGVEEDDTEGDGQTFDDLKAQYEEDEEEEPAEGDVSDEAEADDDDDLLDAFDGDDEDEDDDQVALVGGEPAIDPDEDSGPDVEDDEEGAPGGPIGDTGSRVHGKPYLGTLPDGYATDVIVMEWLTFLVSAGAERGAIEAIQYYHDLDWISADVAATLVARVRRADLGAGRASARPREVCTDHHTRSLAYINHLGGSEDAVLAAPGLGGDR